MFPTQKGGKHEIFSLWQHPLYHTRQPEKSGLFSHGRPITAKRKPNQQQPKKPTTPNETKKKKKKTPLRARAEATK